MFEFIPSWKTVKRLDPTSGLTVETQLIWRHKS